MLQWITQVECTGEGWMETEDKAMLGPGDCYGRAPNVNIIACMCYFASEKVLTYGAPNKGLLPSDN